MTNDINIGATSRLKNVDHTETYGRHILQKISQKLSTNSINQVLDLGCGGGADLDIIKAHHLDASLYGIDCFSENFNNLQAKGIKPINIDIESEALPFEDKTLDFIIANQVLEHTKEIFWINHEIFRTLKVGGYLYLGVPNVLSLHNRILGLFGIHPTQHKLLSAHVRPFSKKDTELFYQIIGEHFTEIKDFAGSQFYPFPQKTARIISRIYPNLSFSIFFLIQKTAEYNNEFIRYLEEINLETNFISQPKK